MKKKLKKTWRERAVLGARRQRPDAAARSGSRRRPASHRAPGRQRLAGHAGGGELGHGPSPMPRSDRARWCRRAQSNSGCMRIRRAARPPGRRGAAGRWPPAGTRRRWPGQGLPARAGRAGPRGARPRCGRGAERRAVWTARTAQPTWPASGGRVSGTGEGGWGEGRQREGARRREEVFLLLLACACCPIAWCGRSLSVSVSACLAIIKTLKENSPQGCTGSAQGAAQVQGALTLWTLQSVAQPSLG